MQKKKTRELRRKERMLPKITLTTHKKPVQIKPARKKIDLSLIDGLDAPMIPPVCIPEKYQQHWDSVRGGWILIHRRSTENRHN